MFGVLRFVIQPFSLVLGRQPMNAKPQNIEQANFEGLGRSLPSVGEQSFFLEWGQCFLGAGLI